MNIVTIGGTKEFRNFELAATELDRIFKEHKIPKKDLVVYLYEDSFKPEGAYIAGKLWADKNNYRVADGNPKDDKRSWETRKKERDETLAKSSKLFINLRAGSKNGGTGIIDVFKSHNVPVAIIDESPKEDTSKLTPVQRRKGEVPDAETVKQSVAVYSIMAQKLLETRSVTLDTETTGISDKDQVVEIAVGDNYSGTILFDSLIKPSIRISDEASKINGITEEMLADAPTIAEIWDKLDAIIGNRIVVVSHSVSGVKCFDQRLINQSLAEVGKKCGFLFFDIQPLYRLYSSQHNERDYPLRTDGMALQLGVEAGGHRAAGDVSSQIKILQAMASGVIPDFTV